QLVDERFLQVVPNGPLGQAAGLDPLLAVAARLRIEEVFGLPDDAFAEEQLDELAELRGRRALAARWIELVIVGTEEIERFAFGSVLVNAVVRIPPLRRRLELLRRFVVAPLRELLEIRRAVLELSVSKAPLVAMLCLGVAEAQPLRLTARPALRRDDAGPLH